MTLSQQGLLAEDAAKKVDLTSHAADFPHIRAAGTDIRTMQRIYDRAANPNAPMRHMDNLRYPVIW